MHIIFEKHSTCFGRSFRPSSGHHDCTLLQQAYVKQIADGLLASSQPAVPDDGRKDRPKHVVCFSQIK
jgi:hypothetical protein